MLRHTCTAASYRDKLPCATEDFLFCFENRGFNHIFQCAALIAVKVTMSCAGTSTVLPCKYVGCEFGRDIEVFPCPSHTMGWKQYFYLKEFLIYFFIFGNKLRAFYCTMGHRHVTGKLESKPSNFERLLIFSLATVTKSYITSMIRLNKLFIRRSVKVSLLQGHLLFKTSNK